MQQERYKALSESQVDTLGRSRVQCGVFGGIDIVFVQYLRDALHDGGDCFAFGG